jgi:rare lipoprotein A
MIVQSRYKRLVLLLLLVALSACSIKHVATTYTRKPEKRDYSGLPATQRPYVINGITYFPIPSAEGFRERGIASWYGKDFQGNTTSNGEIYDMYGQTAAHKILPMNTVLLVRNLENGREAVVRVNDRGPFVKDRIIDLSYATACSLGIAGKGTGKVEIIALEEDESRGENRMAINRQSPLQENPATLQPKTRKKKMHDFNKGDFYVQVGSFETRGVARKTAEYFAGKGKNVIIQQVTRNSRNLFRVLVHGGESLSAARKFEQQLTLAGFPDSMVVAR